MVSGFLPAPAPEAPQFPPFPGGGPDTMGSHPCIRSAESCLSFPIEPKARAGDLQRDVGRSKKWTKGTGRGGGLGRLGPCPFSKPRSPRLPSPAWHLSHPDNGTSPGGACACVPARRPEGEQGFPGGSAGRQGGERGSGHGAGRDAGPGSRMRPRLQRGRLRSQTCPSSKGPPNSAKAATGQRRLLP